MCTQICENYTSIYILEVLLLSLFITEQNRLQIWDTVLNYGTVVSDFFHFNCI